MFPLDMRLSRAPECLTGVSKPAFEDSATSPPQLDRVRSNAAAEGDGSGVGHGALPPGSESQLHHQLVVSPYLIPLCLGLLICQMMRLTVPTLVLSRTQ